MTVTDLHQLTAVLIQRGHGDAQVYTLRKRNGRMYCINFEPEVSGVKQVKNGILRDKNGTKAIIG